MNCAHCTEKAILRCRKHRMHLCGGSYCVALHRWGYAGADKPKGGDCEYVDPRRTDWLELFLALTGVAVAITATALAYAHWWRIR